MLKKTSEELHGFKFHGAPALTTGLFVLEKDIPTLNLDDAMVGDGHLENIRRQVFDAVFAVAHSLTYIWDRA